MSTCAFAFAVAAWVMRDISWLMEAAVGFSGVLFTMVVQVRSRSDDRGLCASSWFELQCVLSSVHVCMCVRVFVCVCRCVPLYLRP